ncbi:hypothetical protein C8A03DRAFT_18240 [Achaetomium macrosporum]|uniref:Infection structure specific protein n=1 Tax=Achaetomium macrosporum TaxID=79813 RepID=A0AAN7H905_9PEZI|nr:hypothetical protein C8A03DRAFT_18240 [Achaetomium macrosporum]
MHAPALIAAMTGVSLAVANPAPPQPIITAGPIVPHYPAGPRGVLATRQIVATESRTGDISQRIACQRSYLSLADSAPTPPARVVSWLLTAAPFPAITDTDQLTDDSLTTLCDAIKTITPPASLTDAYLSYTESVSDWASSVAPAASSVASLCGGLESAMIMLDIATDSESCTSAVQDLLEVVRAEISSTSTAAGTETETGTETSGGGGESSTSAGSGAAVTITSSSSTAGAAVGPRETGCVAAAAVVVVGIAAAVAAL